MPRTRSHRIKCLNDWRARGRSRTPDHLVRSHKRQPYKPMNQLLAALARSNHSRARYNHGTANVSTNHQWIRRTVCVKKDIGTENGASFEQPVGYSLPSVVVKGALDFGRLISAVCRFRSIWSAKLWRTPTVFPRKDNAFKYAFSKNSCFSGIMIGTSISWSFSKYPDDGCVDIHFVGKSMYRWWVQRRWQYIKLKYLCPFRSEW